MSNSPQTPPASSRQSLLAHTLITLVVVGLTAFLVTEGKLHPYVFVGVAALSLGWLPPAVFLNVVLRIMQENGRAWLSLPPGTPSVNVENPQGPVVVQQSNRRDGSGGDDPPAPPASPATPAASAVNGARRSVPPPAPDDASVTGMHGTVPEHLVGLAGAVVWLRSLPEFLRSSGLAEYASPFASGVVVFASICVAGAASIAAVTR